MKTQPHSAYLPTLDGWRAIAIGMVMMSHASDDLARLPGLVLGHGTAGVKALGLLGVHLFFALSGLLITSRLLDEEARAGRISLAAFYVRRTFRILPAALVFLLAVGVLALTGLIPVSLQRWLATLLFMANYSHAEHSWYLAHFWSLAVEEHFYLLWPLAFLWMRTIPRRLALAVTSAMVVALWRAIDFKWRLSGDTTAQFWGRTDIQADAILWGVVVALLFAHPACKPRLQRWLSAPGTALLLAAALVVMQGLPALDWKLDFALITAKLMLIPLLLLATVLGSQSMAGRLLEAKPMQFAGRLSYSLYLWQQPFLVWETDRVPGLAPLQTLPWSLLAVLLLAWLSHRWVELPAIALGSRILRARRAVTAPATMTRA